MLPNCLLNNKHQHALKEEIKIQTFKKIVNTMSSIQSKITIHVKKPIITHSKEEIRSIETSLEIRDNAISRERLLKLFL